MIIIYKGKSYCNLEDVRAAANMSSCKVVQAQIDDMEAGYRIQCWRIVHEDAFLVENVLKAWRDTAMEAAQALEERRKAGLHEIKNWTLNLSNSVKRLAALEVEWTELQETIKTL
jgi:hypothetical protein